MGGIVLATPKRLPPKGIVYGAPGVGKTTFGAGMAKPLIVDIEGGADAAALADIPKTQQVENWAQLLSILEELAGQPQPYKTIVIDTLDWALRLIESHITDTDKSGIKGELSKNELERTLGKSHGGWGNGQQVFTNYVFRLLLPVFDRIRNNGMAIMLLAHARHDLVEVSDGSKQNMVVADIPAKLLQIFVEWAGFVGLAHVDRDGRRLLRCEGTDRILAKNRIGLPAVMELSPKAFEAAFGGKVKGDNNGPKATE